MTRKVPLLHKTWMAGIFFSLILFNSLLFSAETKTDTAFFEVKIENNHSVISIKSPQYWDFKLLSEPPAGKILLKAFPIESNSKQKLKFLNRLTSKGGVKSFRAITLKPQNYLVTLGLKDKLKFHWESGKKNRIVVNDGYFFDESEFQFHKGLALHKLGKLREALNAYRNAIAKNKQNGNAYYKAAQIRLAFKQRKLAEINFRHAERLGCDSLNLFLQMSSFFKDDGRLALSKKYHQIYRQKVRENLGTKNEPALASNVVRETSVPEVADSDTLLSNAQPGDSGQEPESAQKAIPTKLILYSLGSLLLLIFIGWRVREMLQKSTPEPQEMEDSEILDEMIEDLNRSIGRDTSVEKIVEETNPAENSGESGTTQTEEKVRFVPEETEQFFSRESAPDEVDFLESKNALNVLFSGENGYSREKKTEVAKDLNLGLGEIDLALNLDNEQRNFSRTVDRENEIIRLHEAKMSISEIARSLEMGQGEVDLFLRFRYELQGTDD